LRPADVETEMKKPLSSTLGENPAAKPRARVELSGFNLSLLTATIAMYHNLWICCQVLFKIFVPIPKLPEESIRKIAAGFTRIV
jgi:hypothetical protein